MDGRIDLERARRDAKALLRAARDGDAAALARMRADRAPSLADAQRAVAVSLGAPSWPALVRRVEAARGEELLAAARAGRADDVYRLLVAGAPANARDASGATALHVAASRGWADVVSVLVGWVPVDRGAVDAAGETAWSDDRVVAKMLVSGGVPVPSGAIARAPAELADWLRSRRPPARDAALGEAAWAAEAALFAYLAGSPLASRRPVGDGFAFRTGLFDNTRNGIVCSRVDGGLADVLAWLDAPAQWLVGAGSDLRARLERAGCRPERTAVFMAAELGEPQPADSAATPADGAATPADGAATPADGAATRADGIVAIEDEATLRAALAATDELEPDAGEAALLASLGLSGDRSLRHFAAFRDGAPVGLVSTFSSASALTITNLAVAPEWRRRGLGRALVRHVARGLTLLAPTPATIPFYEGLGFRLLRFPPDRTFYTPAG